MITAAIYTLAGFGAVALALLGYLLIRFRKMIPVAVAMWPAFRSGLQYGRSMPSGQKAELSSQVSELGRRHGFSEDGKMP